MRTSRRNYNQVNTKDVFVIWSNKPQFAVSKIIINDDNEVYVTNGSDAYKVDFVGEVYDIITNTKGNHGWFIDDKEKGIFLENTLNELFEKDYLGLDGDYAVDNLYSEGKLF